MSQSSHVEGVSVLVDGRVPHFSGRLVAALRAGGCRVEHLPYLTLKTSCIWVARILRSKSKLVHLLQGHYPLLVYLIPLLAGKKLVIHWIGTDVETELRRRGSLIGKMRLWVFSKASKHLTDFKGLQEELSLLPIQADIVPLLPLGNTEYVSEWTDSRAVLVYAPEARAEFYGIDKILDLSMRCQEVQFYVTAHSGAGLKAPDNVHFLGWVEDMESVWRKIRVLLRLTRHDGLSHAVVEALLREKHVIWSREFPHCAWARSIVNLDDLVLETLASPGPNRAGREYVMREFETGSNLRAIINAYRQVLSM